MHDGEDHHHHPSEELAENIFAFGFRRKIEFAGTMSREQIEQRLKRLFLLLGTMFSDEGMIPGHIKGVCRIEDALCFFSMTRADLVEQTEQCGWERIDAAHSCELTLNILSLRPAQITEETILGILEILHDFRDRATIV
ncbi:MAG: hypothetical protein LBN12_01550 [Clostridiales Family XIII bacterium]|jgi:hypothetical protein|nr:hypothetical protein [Clostridiales Family XIII bacterium]